MKFKRTIFLITIICLACLFSTSCNRRIYFVCGIGEVAQTGINHFQPLIDALEKYKTDHGKYPTEDTVDFVPKYIDRIPVLDCTGTKPGILTTDNVLKDKRLCGGIGKSSDDENNFSIKFYPEDNRICLMGRNNICEYSSESKKWSCYQ